MDVLLTKKNIEGLLVNASFRKFNLCTYELSNQGCELDRFLFEFKFEFENLMFSNSSLAKIHFSSSS